MHLARDLMNASWIVLSFVMFVAPGEVTAQTKKLSSAIPPWAPWRQARGWRKKSVLMKSMASTPI